MNVGVPIAAATDKASIYIYISLSLVQVTKATAKSSDRSLG